MTNSEPNDPNDPRYWSNDERTIKPRRELQGADRWLTDVLYYGLWQLMVLGWPMVYLIYQSPVNYVTAKTAAITSVVTIPVCIGLFRGGHLTVGRPWPAITNAKLGTGSGYRAYLTRSVYLSCTLGLATYAGVFLGVATGSAAVTIVIAAAVSTVGIAGFPLLSKRAIRVRIVRLGYYALGLAVVGIGALPLDLRVGDPILGPALFVLLLVLALADGWSAIIEVYRRALGER